MNSHMFSAFTFFYMNCFQRDDITSSDFWKQRPLTEEMICYATQDVKLFIPKLYKKLMKYVYTVVAICTSVGF